jgi:hypothetical protein
MTFVLDIFHNLKFLETTFWKMDPFVLSGVSKVMSLLSWAWLERAVDLSRYPECRIYLYARVLLVRLIFQPFLVFF